MIRVSCKNKRKGSSLTFPSDDVIMTFLLDASMVFSFCLLIGSKKESASPLWKRLMKSSLAAFPTASARSTYFSMSAATGAPEASEYSRSLSGIVKGFVIQLTIYLDTGAGKHRQLINVSELSESVGEQHCATLLGFYVWTGEDCTSSFKGKGKVGPLKKLEKNPRFQQTFSQLGNDWNLNPGVDKMLEQFTCLMFGYGREKSVDSVRTKMLQKMVGEDKKLTSKSKVDLARIPPCQASLSPHNQRVNHRFALYKRAHEAIVEKPKPYDAGQGWMRNDDGVLEPVWNCKPILPTSLIDLLETVEDLSDESEEEDEDIDSDNFVDSDDD